MKVIFTIDNIIQSSLGGGLIQVMKYAKLLKDKGIEYEWLTAESDTDEAFEEHWNIKVRTIPMPPGISLQRKRDVLLSEAYRTAGALPKGERAVSTDSCGVSFDAISQIWKGHFAGIPACHNTSMLPGPMPTRWLGAMRLKLQTRLFLEGHAVLVPQTETTRRFYADYFGFSGRKVQVISNGVDCSRFAPASPEIKTRARRELGVPDDALVVLSVGSVIPRKGMHLLIEAWPEVLRRFPNARLVIAGTLGRRATFGDGASTLDDFAQRIHDLINALPNSQSVMLSGGQVSEVETYHQAADAFAFASEREGLPNAVLEAMASGLPCVLAPYAGFSEDGEELGTSGTHFIKSDHTPASLAFGMTTLLADETLRRSMGGAARKLMQDTQDLPMIVDRWAELFRRIAHG